MSDSIHPSLGNVYLNLTHALMIQAGSININLPRSRALASSDCMKNPAVDASWWWISMFLNFEQIVPFGRLFVWSLVSKDSGNDFDHFLSSFLEVRSGTIEQSNNYPTRNKKIRVVSRIFNWSHFHFLYFIFMLLLVVLNN